MKSDGPAGADDELRDRLLAGLAAAAELDLRFRAPLERFLFGLCDRGDGRSQEKAVEIAGQVLADCFTKSPSLLERWKGPDNLEAFLRTAARNKLKSWWSSAEKRRTEVNSESLTIANAAADVAGADADELEVAARALRAGVAAAVEESPEGLVFMRLKGLHGVDQRAISACWGHHESQTSRRVKEAMDVIRKTAAELAEKSDVELSPELLRRAMERDPDVLLGAAAADGAAGDYESLKLFAEGGTDAQTKRELVASLCRNADRLAFFARALNRKSGLEALVIKDPALAGTAARLERCVAASLEIQKPAEAAALVTELISDSFADLLGDLAADGGTLWLLCPGEAVLEAVFNPLEPELAGKRQPLASGIVSLVLATGEPARMSAESGDRRHSPVIDLALGKTTRSMIAVPFRLAGATRGVLTAVRLTGDAPFDDGETARLARHAAVMEELIERGLTRAILE